MKSWAQLLPVDGEWRQGRIYAAELLPVNNESPSGLVFQTEKCAQQ